MEDRFYERGDLIGHHQVLALLGCGGFSAVYEVQDVNEGPGDKPCALKISRHDCRTVATEVRHELNTRTRREFELLQHLEHQSIVAVYEFGVHEGAAYYVMEKLDGVPLSSYLAEQPRTYGELAFLLQRIASALSHAHREGVVHRDLTPGNVLVERQLRRVEDSEDGLLATGEDDARASSVLRDEMTELIKRVEERVAEWLPWMKDAAREPKDGARSDDATPLVLDERDGSDTAGQEPAEGEEASENPAEIARKLVSAAAEGFALAERRPVHLPEVGRVPVLIDFGLAHGVGLAAITAPGALLGTVEFIPPGYAAQLLSDRPVRHQAESHEDVYQAGVLLYAMLTGQLPTRTPAARVVELLTEIRDAKPPHVLEVNPDAPPALAALAMQCLEKRSQRRPADGAALLWRVNAAIYEDQQHLARLAPLYRVPGLHSAETELHAPESDARSHAVPQPAPAPEPSPAQAPEPAAVPAAPSASPEVANAARSTSWRLEVALRSLIRSNLGARRTLRTALAATALVFLGCMGLGLRMHWATERADLRAARLDEQRDKLSQALADTAHAQWLDANARALLQGTLPSAAGGAAASIPGTMPPGQVGMLATTVLRGLKMPEKEKMNPNWLRPGPDGVCRDPQTGEEAGITVVLRGVCFQVTGRLGKSCPNHSFDPPPEVFKDPKLEDLRNKCFNPYDIHQDGRSVTPK